jgi:hypothetical protein
MGWVGGVYATVLTDILLVLYKLYDSILHNRSLLSTTLSLCTDGPAR